MACSSAPVQGLSAPLTAKVLSRLVQNQKYTLLKPKLLYHSSTYCEVEAQWDTMDTALMAH